jgi:hypothetical protein
MLAHFRSSRKTATNREELPPSFAQARETTKTGGATERSALESDRTHRLRRNSQDKCLYSCGTIAEDEG